MTEDFQRLAGEQGRTFEEAVCFVLQAGGWQVKDRRVKVEGVEIDIVAVDPNGDEWWVECKGSFRGKTPGSKRGDTVKKAVGVAWYLSTVQNRRPYMLATSHLPTAGTLGERLLKVAVETGLFQQVNVLGFLADLPDEDEDDE